MTPEQMAALHAQTFTVPRPWSEAEFRDLLASPLVFAITQPGGFLLGRVVAGEAELLTVAVQADHRRQGIGRGLVQAFLTESRARGAESVFLEVAANNAPAQALYAETGFVQAGRRRNYYIGPDGVAQDALVMVCSEISPS